MKPDAELYKAAEACRMAEVAPYVLRYWETEFPSLSEGKEKGAARLYTGREVRIISRIRELLYDEGFTVAGAKKRLEAEISEGRFDDGLKPAPSPAAQKKSSPPAPPTSVSEEPKAAFLGGPGAKAKGNAAPASAASTAAASTTRNDFPERKRVVRELREIAKLLERSAPKSR